VRLGRSSLALVQRLATIATFSGDGGQAYRYTGAPRTSFNGRIGPRRAFGFSSVALADVLALKEKFDVKVNDVVLALCDGALRNYLTGNGEHLDAPLVAGVPVSTRGTDTTLDNQIGTMCVQLATDVADPVERLILIHQNAAAAKTLHHEIRAHQLPSIGEMGPPAVLELLLRTLSQTGLASRLPTPMNAIISNVPGPPFDLFMAGGRITGIFPTSVIMETMALNITLFSYGDRIDFGVYADPQAVPDPFLIADGIPAALRELLTEAGLGDPSPVIDPFGEPTNSLLAETPTTSGASSRRRRSTSRGGARPR
jgi:diacylglycerol O-acyltransferase